MLLFRFRTDTSETLHTEAYIVIKYLNIPRKNKCHGPYRNDVVRSK